jgi:proton glutamate symport protein
MKDKILYALIPAVLIALLQCLVGLDFLTINTHFNIWGTDITLMAIFRWIGFSSVIYYAWKTGKKITFWILLSLLLGAEIGYDFPEFAKSLDVLSKIFLKLIKTIIAPLLFSTLVIGVAGHSDMKQVGRMGLKALTYFIAATSIALVFGLLAINFTQAGADPRINRQKAEKLQSKVSSVKKNWKELAAPMVVDRTEKLINQYETAPDSLKSVVVQNGIDSLQATFIAAKKTADLPPKQDMKEFFVNIFPENIAKAIAENQVLPIVVFSLLFAFGISAAGGEHRTRMLHFCESLAQIMFKFTNFIMYFAPFGVLGAMASAVSAMGLDIFIPMLKLIGTLYMALFFFVVIVFGAIALVMKINIRTFLKAVQEPVSIAFGTASSEAALGPAMIALKKYGVPERYVSFVLPTGMSFNLDGSTLYLSCAAVFVAQASHHEVATNIGMQITMLLVLLVSSKGIAGVARASLVILMGTIGQFGIEEWPIYLILGVDVLMDMVRTGVNMLGNCLATVVIAKWEGEFEG